MGLSEAARSVWAKSPNSVGDWLPLWQHMDDAADVAGWLFDRWLPGSVVELLARDLGGDVVAARAAVRFLAGVHDVGKATPAFAIQHDLLAQRMREFGLSMPTSKRELPDRDQAHHTVTGHHLLVAWLGERRWRRSVARSWGVVVGGHHGVPLESDPADTAQAYPCLFGQGLWRSVQWELADRVAARTGAADYLDRWRDVKLSTGFQVLATGLVIMSDWIASSEELLPFLHGALPAVDDGDGRAVRGLRRLALPGPWRPDSANVSVAQLFASRFRLPEGSAVRPVQVAACEAAEEMAGPGLLVVEAPMGEGKTEAALAAAELMAARWGAGGVQVALPTQATTNAMFDRVLAWLDAMGADGQQVGAVTLSHGKARLHREFDGLVREGWLPRTGIGCDEEDSADPQLRRGRHAVVVHAWLAGRKKAPLANFVVGTIDQLLFAALKARHVMLRHLGLAGKVVILDEVHAYDAYMNSYLLKTLTWLGAYRVPVIALSATLPADRRTELLQAYQRGRLGAPPAPPAVQVGYPLLSWTAGTEVGSRVVEPSGRTANVAVQALGGAVDDDFDELTAVLKGLLSGGGCALVVRNTVRRVLATAERLEAEFPGEVIVTHARFIAADRARKDAELLDDFGPHSGAPQRLRRRIVVASQVVEQSLDVDFDVLVTDLAPIDLVLQRMGRLHRHQRGDGQSQRPPKLRQARTYLAAVDFSVSPPALEPAAARHVYQSYPLLRAAAVLLPCLGSVISLPDDIAPLVQNAYRPEPIGPGSWQAAMAEARQRWHSDIARRTDRAMDHQLADPGRPGKPIVGWLSANVGDADDAAQGQGQVRDGAPSLEVVLIQTTDTGEWQTPSWLPDGDGGLPIPRDVTPDDSTARVMADCALRLPLDFSSAEAEEELWQATPPAWESSLVIYRLPALVVDERGRGRLAGKDIRYTRHTGLVVTA
ncbi:CRISPR-associated helicase Cas3' [Nocardia wallacei]|uniref:CRISPR-associated helicase Cas3' n=1 Tax=Nocardia wallacei TaxID=480035 RepID=UPI002456AADB|nr:CRISPR-associated helicase Cas3' [Nocardia wallacei]